jgi:hypothetical protein
VTIATAPIPSFRSICTSCGSQSADAKSSAARLPNGVLWGDDSDIIALPNQLQYKMRPVAVMKRMHQTGLSGQGIYPSLLIWGCVRQAPRCANGVTGFMIGCSRSRTVAIQSAPRHFLSDSRSNRITLRGVMILQRASFVPDFTQVGLIRLGPVSRRNSCCDSWFGGDQPDQLVCSSL